MSTTGSLEPEPGADRQPLRDLSDLPGRVQLAAVAVFLLLWAAIAFVPRLWGQDLFYEHFYWIGVALGPPWWLAVQRFGPRVARHPLGRGAEVGDAQLLHKVRRAARSHRARRASAWFIVPTVVLVGVGGHFSSRFDQELIDEQPHRTATVVSVERSPLAGRSEGPEVTVDLGGREVVLFLSFPEEDGVEPGDPLAVVVDPDDPGYAIAVSSHDDWPWAYTWWGELLVILVVGGAIGGFWLMWALSVPTRAARASARHARAVRVVDLVEVDGDRLVLRAGDGGEWVWSVDGDTWDGPTGGRLRVIGELRDGEWPVLEADLRLRWPGAPLRCGAGGG